MSLRDKFCPSPWFHMRITNSGDFQFCRWASERPSIPGHNIRDIAPIAWFQSAMNPVRRDFLQGASWPGCSDCHAMEQHGKVSGRHRQLVKIGVRSDFFNKSMLSSPWYQEFHYSSQTQGSTQLWPQDWQIDLGNYCNSACVFCTPEYSSRLASEYKKIGLIDQSPPPTWCDDPDLLQRFVDTLTASPHLQYLHFIGGETLITPAFEKILRALIHHDLHHNTVLGFTTNLTTWNQSVVDLLCEFKEIHLGMSIECVTPLNDYLRYGGNLTESLDLLDRWIAVGQQHQWLMQIRSTPTVLSIWHLDTLYQYARSKNIPIESCNFLDRPEFFRPSVLPHDLRQQVINRLEKLIDHSNPADDVEIVNSRSPEFYTRYMSREIRSYMSYLAHQPDESFRLPDLVGFLKKLEANRRNCVLDYLPEYETILRSAGY